MKPNLYTTEETKIVANFYLHRKFPPKRDSKTFLRYSHRNPLQENPTNRLNPLTTPYTLFHNWAQITLENRLLQHSFRFHRQSTPNSLENTPNKSKNLSQETYLWSWSKSGRSTILYRQISKTPLTNSQPTEEHTKPAQKLETRHYTRSKNDHDTRI